MGDYYLVFELAWRVSDAVSSCDQEAIRSKFGVSYVMTHFIVLVSWFVVGDLSRSEMSYCSFT